MPQQLLEPAGLQTLALTPAPSTGGKARRVGVVLLHGYAMDAADLAPFGASLQLPAHFFFPRAPHAAAKQGRTWWDIDIEARATALANGARDLFELYPDGLEAARGLLVNAIRALMAEFTLERIVLGGFSQGGMLACDTTLHGELPVSGLVLLSASRITLPEWLPRAAQLHGLPVFSSHGRHDADLSFTAGERLRDFAQAAGAHTTWVPFDGGHEIPLPVWRALRKFLAPLL